MSARTRISAALVVAVLTAPGAGDAATYPPTVLVAKLGADLTEPTTVVFASTPGNSFECIDRTVHPTYTSGPYYGPQGWKPCESPMTVPTSGEFLVHAVAPDGTTNPSYAIVSLDLPRRTLPDIAGEDAIVRYGGHWSANPGCVLDAAPWSPCERRWVELAPGPHTLRVRGPIYGEDTVLETPDLTWTVPTPPVLRLIGAQFPAVIERSPRLQRRPPRVRFVLSRPAALTVTLGATDGRRLATRHYSGGRGANAIGLPRGLLAHIPFGRYRLTLTATDGTKARVTVSLSFAVVAYRR